MSSSWKHSFASVVGTKHQKKAQICQDASCSFWDDETQSLFLAVADGAGSALNASAGSQASINAFYEKAPYLLKQQLSKGRKDADAMEALLVELASYVRSRLTSLGHADAQASRGGLSTVATTFLCVICSPDFFAALQVGDGLIVTASQAGELRTCFQPIKGEYANETCFITSEGSIDDLIAQQKLQLKVEARASVKAIALLSDGLEYLTMDMKAIVTPRASFFAGLFKHLFSMDEAEFKGNLEDYLLRNKQINDYTDDDKTLVLAIDASFLPKFKVQPLVQEKPKELRKRSVKPKEPKVIQLSSDYTPPKPPRNLKAPLEEPEFKLLLDDEDGLT